MTRPVMIEPGTKTRLLFNDSTHLKYETTEATPFRTWIADIARFVRALGASEVECDEAAQGRGLEGFVKELHDRVKGLRGNAAFSRGKDSELLDKAARVLEEYQWLRRELGAPPEGWQTLGSSANNESRVGERELEFWGVGADGLPMWERLKPVPIPFAELESIIDAHMTDDRNPDYCACGATWGPGHVLLALIGDQSEFGVHDGPTPLTGLVAKP